MLPYFFIYMADLKIEIKNNRKIYFASDLHLGLSAFSREQEIAREKKIISWLNSIEKDAQAIFFVGDIFDFWFEYKYVVPKGYIRFLGKIASLIDQGIDIYFFTGNHDLWMFRYLQSELGVTIFYNPIELDINGTKMLIGHGDGLGPGDRMYKLLKKVFTNSFAKWLFRWTHPDLGLGLATRWSKASRLSKADSDEVFLGEKEYLIQYCREMEGHNPHDYYIFGHRHLSLEIDITESSKYINLGEWVKACTYGVFDGNTFRLQAFKP
jgi:UDP-2,3-diacylglucosamine hydrolase